MPLALQIPPAHCESESIGLGSARPHRTTSTKENSLVDLQIHKAKIIRLTKAQGPSKFPTLAPKKTKRLKVTVVKPKNARPAETRPASEIALDFMKYEKGLESF